MTTQLAVTTQPLTPEEQVLIETIRHELEQGFNSVEQTTRITYWKVGRHIKEHLLQNSERAEYGQYLFGMLSENVSIDASDLYKSVKLYESYPQILGSNPKLTWSHLRILVTIADIEKRQQYEEKIITNKLSVTEFKLLRRQDKKAKITGQSKATPVLSVKRDQPYIYQIIKDDDEVEVDLGFEVSSPSPVTEFEADSVVCSQKKGKKYKFILVDKKTSPHYTYKAKVLKVIDGDTIKVKIDLGFKVKIRRKLRLRGIDAPELKTSAGDKVRNYIVSQLKNCKFIAIKTYWRDKYDRYLVDIFYDEKETDFPTLIQNGTFLNQELLDKGYAVGWME